MTLSEEFEKETGKDSEFQDLTYGTWGYSQDYVEWLEAKINYTRCSLQLKDKETMTFQEYLKGLGWEQLSDSFVYKQGNNYKDIEELRKEYIKEYNL